MRERERERERERGSAKFIISRVNRKAQVMKSFSEWIIQDLISETKRIKDRFYQQQD